MLLYMIISNVRASGEFTPTLLEFVSSLAVLTWREVTVESRAI